MVGIWEPNKICFEKVGDWRRGFKRLEYRIESEKRIGKVSDLNQRDNRRDRGNM